MWLMKLVKPAKPPQKVPQPRDGGRPSSFFLHRDWTPQDVVAVLVMKEWANSYLNNIELLINMPEEKKNIPGKVIPGRQYIRYYSAEQAGFLKTLRSIKNLLTKYTGTFNRGLSVYVDSELDASGENYYFGDNDIAGILPAGDENGSFL